MRDAIDAVFDKYDTDHSNTVDVNQVCDFINDALNHMKSNRKVTQAQVNQLIPSVDKSGDGRLHKPEIFQIFKKAAFSYFWAIRIPFIVFNIPLYRQYSK